MALGAFYGSGRLSQIARRKKKMPFPQFPSAAGGRRCRAAASLPSGAPAVCVVDTHLKRRRGRLKRRGNTNPHAGTILLVKECIIKGPAGEWLDARIHPEERGADESHGYAKRHRCEFYHHLSETVQVHTALLFPSSFRMTQTEIFN